MWCISLLGLLAKIMCSIYVVHALIQAAGPITTERLNCMYGNNEKEKNKKKKNPSSWLISVPLCIHSQGRLRVGW